MPIWEPFWLAARPARRAIVMVKDRLGADGPGGCEQGGATVAEDLAVTFTGFVISLMTTAAVHFGDYPDPATGEKKPLNLEGASQMIEVLGMLEQKTRGNLTAQERSMLDQVLYDLRMRYVAAQQYMGPVDSTVPDPS